jgi:hypothetical protein
METVGGKCEKRGKDGRKRVKTDEGRERSVYDVRCERLAWLGGHEVRRV